MAGQRGVVTAEMGCRKREEKHTNKDTMEEECFVWALMCVSLSRQIRFRSVVLCLSHQPTRDLGLGRRAQSEI